MKKLFLLLALAIAIPAFPCTNFLAGKNATVDGSTLISYAADSYWLFGALYHQPAADHQPGSMRAIYDWDSGKYLGEIPEVAHTYNVIGNMNEHQVAIAETTYGGREELADSTGLMDYGSLIYVALQRAKTAREAIKIMTDLVAKYGYYSEGESFSIGDPNEVWIMEMIGKGPGRKGAVWVAQRIPDDCVSGHANQARITTINFKDKDNFLYAKDVIKFAREKGYFKGKDSEFSFSDVYNPLDLSGAYACEARVWAIFRQLTPGMDQYLPYIKGEDPTHRMPLYIKPDHKVSAQEFKGFMRNQYEGTELDITKGEGAGPWNSKLRYGSLAFEVDGEKYWFPRPIATQQTGWSFVAQMRGSQPKVGGIFWFGVDDAATNLYVPMYSKMTAVPWCYDENNGSMLDYSETSAFWTFNRVANFAYSKYSAMLPDIRAKQKEWEDKFNQMIPYVDKTAADLDDEAMVKYLTNFSCKQAEESTLDWKKLGEYLLVKYLDGQQKGESEPGVFKRGNKNIPGQVIRAPYPEDFRRRLKNENIKNK